MRKRARRAKKREMNESLLQTIYTLQYEWQELQSIVNSSIDPTEYLVFQEKIAQKKYMYLLREARLRKVQATAMNKS